MPATVNGIILEVVIVDATGAEIPNLVVTQPDAAARISKLKAGEASTFTLDVLNEAPNTDVPLVGASGTYQADPADPNDANVLSGFDLNAPVTIPAGGSALAVVKMTAAVGAQLGKRGKYRVLLQAA